MTDKKTLLAKFLWRSRTLRSFRRWSSPGLAVLNYHRIRGDGAPAESAFEDTVFGPTASEFDRQMAWVSKNTEVLSEGDVIARLERGTPFAAPSCAVTFDDAYVDNFEVALPILRRHGIPAIFFVPTGLVTDRTLGWWDLVAYVLKRTDRARITFGGAELSLADRSQAIAGLIRAHKNGGRELDLDALSRACGVPLPSQEIQGGELMTWDQIRAAARAGIAIGSHTHSHPVLARLPAEEQRRELACSRSILEAELGQRIRSLAYPFGGPHHYGRDAVDAAAACGYELAFTFHGGFNRSGAVERFELKRFEVSSDYDLMAASTVLPAVFS